MNVNLYATRIQSYVAVLKMIHNTGQNDKQNANETPGDIPVFNNFFEILKSPFFENETSGS